MLTKEYLKDHFIDAYFIDNERQNIEILTTSPDGKSVNPTIIPHNRDHTMYQALLSVISLDEVHERTHTKKQEEKKLFNKQVLEIAKKEGLVFDESQIGVSSYPSIVKLLFNDDKNEDHIFALKLALFEIDKIKDSANTELKSNIRKGKSKSDILLNAIKIMGEK